MTSAKAFEALCAELHGFLVERGVNNAELVAGEMALLVVEGATGALTPALPRYLNPLRKAAYDYGVAARRSQGEYDGTGGVYE